MTRVAHFHKGGIIKYRCVFCGYMTPNSSEVDLQTDREQVIYNDTIRCVTTFRQVCKDNEACKERQNNE